MTRLARATGGLGQAEGMTAPSQQAVPEVAQERGKKKTEVKEGKGGEE